MALPAYNLAFHGRTGIHTLEPTGFWLGNDLPGIQRLDYLTMPLQMVVEAVWFRLFGFSMASMRALSILWGIVMLVASFLIFAAWADATAALVATTILAIDFTFLWTAADGRMDMMCTALWSMGVALYLQYRAISFRRALLLANVFTAASIFTHPNGMLGVLLLGTLIVTHDRPKLAATQLWLCWPYAIGLVGWAGYALLNPAYFIAQLAVNSSKDSGRLNLLPWDSIRAELLIRHLRHFFGFHTWSKPAPTYGVMVLLLYWCGCVSLIPLRRTQISVRYALRMVIVLLGSLTLLVGFKAPNYLVNVLPAYAMCSGLAVVLWVRSGSTTARTTVIGAGSLFLLVQFSVIEYKIRHSEYHDYRAVVDFIKKNASPQDTILANSYFFFDLPEYNLHDDSKLGYRSYLHPDLIVADPWYVNFWENVYPYSNPGAWLFLVKTFRNNLVPIYKAGRYTVYTVR